jgi:mRNA interferase MazF
LKQFEIWWAELPAPVGRRPVLLLTRTPAYGYLNKVVVAELTTTVRGIPQEVALGAAEGVAACVANLDNVHAIAKARLVARAGALAPKRHAEVKLALGHAFDWGEILAAR